MTNIDHATNQLRENELVAVSGGMEMTDPLDSGGGGVSTGAVGIGVYAAAGPGGYLIFQGGVGVGIAVRDWWRGRK